MLIVGFLDGLGLSLLHHLIQQLEDLIIYLDILSDAGHLQVTCEHIQRSVESSVSVRVADFFVHT